MTDVLLTFLAVFLAILLRPLRRARWWRDIETDARRILEDVSNPIHDPREAVERALLDAQRAQLDEAERSIRAGGNGLRPPDNGSPR